MGADTVVSGLSPEIVTTLMEMGVELKQFSTALTLEAALEHFGIALDPSLLNPKPRLGASEGRPGSSLEVHAHAQDHAVGPVGRDPTGE